MPLSEEESGAHKITVYVKYTGDGSGSPLVEVTFDAFVSVFDVFAFELVFYVFVLDVFVSNVFVFAVESKRSQSPAETLRLPFRVLSHFHLYIRCTKSPLKAQFLATGSFFSSIEFKSRFIASGRVAGL